MLVNFRRGEDFPLEPCNDVDAENERDVVARAVWHGSPLPMVTRIVTLALAPSDTVGHFECDDPERSRI